MEVSSTRWLLGRVSGVEYDTAVFTNLNTRSFGLSQDFENYLAAKCKLFEQVSQPNQTKSGKGCHQYR